MTTTAYFSSVLDHSVDTVWSLVRDFNNYPAYIEGVSESVIEDDKRGDEIGAVRRFNYCGSWIRQRLVAHSDSARSLTYAGMDRLSFPHDLLAHAPAPTGYQGTIHLMPIVDGGRTFVEWWVDLDTRTEDAAAWHKLFLDWIPEWTESLRNTLSRQDEQGRLHTP